MASAPNQHSPAPTFDAWVSRLAGRLQEPLPGTDAQLRMAPVYRMDPKQARIEGKECREAGVLALLFPMNGTAGLVLTARPETMKEHPGQVSFPGGSREPGETLLETALREAHEEVNLTPDDVDVLGALTPLYIPPSNFCMHPFVGAVPYEPDLTPHDAEVSAILHVGLPHLLDPRTLRREPMRVRGNEVEIPFFAVDGYRIWGATAMVLSELLALCEA